jgi:hypothetical protein
MYSVRQLKWSEVHNKWNDIKFPEPYQQYLQDTFGITITEGRVIWNHVVEVTLVPVQDGVFGGPTDTGREKKKKKCKEIKLIFIMEDLTNTQIKTVCKDKISVKLASSVQNKIEEQLGTKITLKDVQIING